VPNATPSIKAIAATLASLVDFMPHSAPMGALEQAANGVSDGIATNRELLNLVRVGQSQEPLEVRRKLDIHS